MGIFILVLGGPFRQHNCKCMGTKPIPRVSCLKGNCCVRNSRALGHSWGEFFCRSFLGKFTCILKKSLSLGKPEYCLFWLFCLALSTQIDRLQSECLQCAPLYTDCNSRLYGTSPAHLPTLTPASFTHINNWIAVKQDWLKLLLYLSV